MLIRLTIAERVIHKTSVNQSKMLCIHLIASVIEHHTNLKDGATLAVCEKNCCRNLKTNKVKYIKVNVFSNFCLISYF